MEIWKEVYKGIIPKGYYNVKITNSEKTGLVVELEGEKSIVIIDFGYSRAMRMFDEGIVQNGVYSNDELKKYKDNKFENIIYKVENGEFNQEVSKMSFGFTDMIDVKHYILITQNFNIDIITDWEPKLEVRAK